MLEVIPAALVGFIVLWGVEGILYIFRGKLTKKMASVVYVSVLGILLVYPDINKYAMGLGLIGLLIGFLVKRHRMRKGPVSH